MIRDRGSNYTAALDAVLAGAGIRTVLCSVRTPAAARSGHRSQDTRQSAWTDGGLAPRDPPGRRRFSVTVRIDPKIAAAIAAIG